MKNVMLLDDVKSGGVVYVSKNTYDQAILLSGRLDGDPRRVLDILRSPKTEAYRATLGLKGLVENMISSMPKPINMLAPFLIFCVQNVGMEWDADNRELAYGILHQYSQMVDFNGMTLVPVEVRNNLVITTTILMNYQASWDDICSSLKDNVVLGSVQPVIQQVVQPQYVVPAQAPVVTSTASPTLTPVTEAMSTPAPAPAQQSEPVSEEDKKAAAIKEFQEKMAREAEEEEKERQARAKKREERAKAKAVESKPAPAAATEASASNAVLNEYDF